MAKKKGAFTLVEILIVLGIAGIIVSAGVTPLLFTVRTLSNTRQVFTETNRERSVFNRIVQDLRETAQLHVASPIKVIQSEELAEKPRDALIAWTVTPSYAGGPVGNVVYAIPKENLFSDSKGSGLYRWIIVEDITQETDLQKTLEEEDSQLLLPQLEGFSVQMLRGSEWLDGYNGTTPQALRVTFEYEDAERIYEAWFPNS
ncbi:type II secretion system GspH family protein [Synergistaceae bacterium OttesenSCG-928-I11]|nr:type II secretion system GspH family protein [Synergistaceae bacterium OttesenSCG-928-I11]